MLAEGKGGVECHWKNDIKANNCNLIASYEVGAAAMSFEADTERVCQAGHSLGYLFIPEGTGKK